MGLLVLTLISASQVLASAADIPPKPGPGYVLTCSHTTHDCYWVLSSIVKKRSTSVL
jgi:hypothetical protein